MRVEFEYERGGALAYLAAWDVHRAKLFGRCEPTTGIEPFERLVAQVMTVSRSQRAAPSRARNGLTRTGIAPRWCSSGRWPPVRRVSR